MNHINSHFKENNYIVNSINLFSFLLDPFPSITQSIHQFRHKHKQAQTQTHTQTHTHKIQPSHLAIMHYFTTAILVLVTIIPTNSAAPTSINQTLPGGFNSSSPTRPGSFGEFNHTKPGHSNHTTAGNLNAVHGHRPFSLGPRDDIPVFKQDANGKGYCSKGAITGSAYPDGCAIAFWYNWNIKQTRPAEDGSATLYAYNHDCELMGMKSGAEGKFKYQPAGLEKTITVFNADPNKLAFEYGSGTILGPLNCGEFKTSKSGTGFGYVCPFDCTS